MNKIATKENLDFTFEDYLIWKLVGQTTPIPRWSFTDEKFKEAFRDSARVKYELALKDEVKTVNAILNPLHTLSPSSIKQ